MATQERRLRIVRLPYDETLNLMQSVVSGNPPAAFVQDRIAGLPADATVIAVRDDFYNRDFAILVSHPSFDVVPTGCEIPTHDTRLTEAGMFVVFGGD